MRLFKLYIILFIDCGVSLLLRVGFSSCRRGYPSLWCMDFSLQWLLLLQSTRALGHVGSVGAVPGLWSTGSVVVVPGPSCLAAHGIFSDQGSNPCLLHWQADSLPLSHCRSPVRFLNSFIKLFFILVIHLSKWNRLSR